jgi:sugar-specific transcriptional regulator TrmB
METSTPETYDAHEIAAMAQKRRAALEERLKQIEGERVHIKAELALLPAPKRARKARSDKGVKRGEKAGDAT